MNRREAVLQALAGAWDKNSELRLGQLISNSLKGQTLAERDRDLYYLEDAKLMERLEDVWGN